MASEISKDFYCSGNYISYNNAGTPYCLLRIGEVYISKCRDCHCFHRKHPTPEQYKEEYGKEYPDDWAVYFTKAGQWFEYQIDNYATAKNWQKEFPGDIWIIICACTIFGKPDDYWRP